MKIRQIIVLVPIFAIIIFPCQVASLFHRCPETEQQEFYSSCTCQKNSSVFITCQGIQSEDTLESLLLPLRKHVIDHLIIRNRRNIGPLMIIPGTFRKLNVRKMTFQDVQFRIFDLLHSLKGTEFDLEELNFINCHSDIWSFTKGTPFIFLETLTFDGVNLPNVLTKQMFKEFPKNIRKLKIVGCNISEITDGALRTRFTHLEFLELDRNRLTEIKRSSLPVPARRLRHISLISNPITALPSDAFVDMSRLEFVLLSNTLLTALPNETFHHVWDQLEEVYLNGVSLDCNCDVMWLYGTPSSKLIRNPYCTAHRKRLNNIENPNEICPNP